MPVVVRPYRQSDWPSLCRIHDAARRDELRSSLGLEAFLTLVETFEAEDLFGNPVWVAELDERVVGFVSASRQEITWIYVDPAMYRHGVGRALMAQVFAQADDRLELEVLDGNAGARTFYESLGFVWTSTTTGKLAGNEGFAATGHTLVWHRDAARS